MRILLPYNHGASVPDSFYADFHAGLTEAAHELGHDPVSYDHVEGTRVSDAERGALYRLLAKRPCELVIDLCCWSHVLSQLRAWDGSDAGEPIFDAFELTCVGLLCDQPWFQPVQAMASSRAWAAVPDRQHAEPIAQLYPQLALRGCIFAPPAARLVNDRRTGLGGASAKPIDVLYVGNIYAYALQRPWHDTPDAALCDDALAWAKEHEQLPVHRALQEVLRARAIDADAEHLKTLLQSVEFSLRTHIRLDAVRAVAEAGATVHVVGNGWDAMPLPSNVVLHPATGYTGVLDFAAQAKVCIDASTYRHGANDRVFNYTVNGAVCFSNAGGFLGEAFGANGGLHCYSMHALSALGPAIRELLDAPRQLREQAQQARDVTLATQTWRHRLQTIIAAVGDAA